MALTQQSIFNFLHEEFDINICQMVGDTSLIASGLIDSLGVMDFVEFVSQAAGITVQGAEVRLKNFDTVNMVLGFVQQKTNNKGECA